MRMKGIMTSTEQIVERVIYLCDTQADEGLTDDEVEELADLSYELAEYRITDLIQQRD